MFYLSQKKKFSQCNECMHGRLRILLSQSCPSWGVSALKYPLSQKSNKLKKSVSLVHIGNVLILMSIVHNREGVPNHVEGFKQTTV